MLTAAYDDPGRPNGQPLDHDTVKYSVNPLHRGDGRIPMPFVYMPHLRYDGVIKEVSTAAAVAAARPYVWMFTPYGWPDIHWFDERFPEGSLFWPVIPPKVLRDCRQGIALVVMCYINEGPPPTQRLLDALVNECAKCNLPLDRFVVATSNPLFEGPALARGIQAVSTEFYEGDVAWRLRKHPSSFAIVPPPAARPFKFVCYMRRPRRHRYTLALSLLADGLIDEGFVSFPKRSSWVEGWWPSGVDPLVKRGTDRHDELMALSEELEGMELNPHGVDLTDSSIAYGADYPHAYERSYFSIVTETTFSEKGTLFLSEKTWRPVANMHPFIMFGPQGALARVRELGYNTFDGFIDESYDGIEDPSERFAAAYAEVERLARMTRQQLNDWYGGLFNRVVNNRFVLATRRNNLGLAQRLESMI